MTRRVLVTRPEPGASATAARLEQAGFEPVLLPLTRIVPVAVDILPDPGLVDAVVVTSANALRCATAELLAPLARKPVFAVGDATAEAARDAGLVDVHSASGTARDLVRLLRSGLPAGAAILHLAGRERTEGFAEAVIESGYVLQTLELYTAEKIDYSSEFFCEAIGSRPLWGAMVMSLRAGILLAEALSVAAIRQRFEKTTLFCISQKVAQPLREIAGPEIAVSDEPTEDGILRLLLSQA